MFSNFDFDVIARSWPYLFKDGMSFTLMLTALATGAGIVLGTLLALMRLSKFIVLQKFAETYVNIIRSLPLVLVIFWFYFLLPYIGQWVLGSERPMAVGAFMSALVTFSLRAAATEYRCTALLPTDLVRVLMLLRARSTWLIPLALATHSVQTCWANFPMSTRWAPIRSTDFRI